VRRHNTSVRAQTDQRYRYASRPALREVFLRKSPVLVQLSDPAGGRAVSASLCREREETESERRFP